MVRMIIESPFGTTPDGDRASPEEVARNKVYLERCKADSLRRGEAPFASHGFYPGVLDDSIPEERELGILAGFAWGAVAECVAVYGDYGRTAGMQRGIERARRNSTPIIFRQIGENP